MSQATEPQSTERTEQVVQSTAGVEKWERVVTDEVPSLIGVLIYALLGWVIVEVLLPLFVRPTTSRMSPYDRYHSYIV